MWKLMLRLNTIGHSVYYIAKINDLERCIILIISQSKVYQVKMLKTLTLGNGFFGGSSNGL